MPPQGRDKAVVESLAQWAADEYADKRGETVDTSGWKRRYLTVRPGEEGSRACVQGLCLKS